MATTGKTIQFYLPDGEPRGIRIAEITTRIVQAVAVPRALLDRAKEREELRSVGVYLLLGRMEEGAKPPVYVGQSENPYKRLNQHTSDDRKDFWETAVVFVSRTNSFTLTHVRFLEYHCQVIARDAGRYALQNAVESEPFVPEPMKADLLDAFDTMSILVSALGYPVFDALRTDEARDVYTCTGPDGASGTGAPAEDGFAVYAGATIRQKVVPSAQQTIGPMRERLVESGVLIERDGRLMFAQNYQFGSPSSAAMVILGRTANGWREWKAQDGRTLDEVMRQDRDANDET